MGPGRVGCCRAGAQAPLDALGVIFHLSSSSQLCSWGRGGGEGGRGVGVGRCGGVEGPHGPMWRRMSGTKSCRLGAINRVLTGHACRPLRPL